MLSHAIDYPHEVHLSQQDVVVLEDHHELLRNLLHYIENIISESMPLRPLIYVYPLHLADHLPQPLFKLGIVTPRFVRNITALVLAGLLPNLGTITHDVYINFSEAILPANAVEGHFDDFSAGVGGYGTRCYYNGEILLFDSGLFVLHCSNNNRNYKRNKDKN